MKKMEKQVIGKKANISLTLGRISRKER